MRCIVLMDKSGMSLVRQDSGFDSPCVECEMMLYWFFNIGDNNGTRNIS